MSRWARGPDGRRWNTALGVAVVIDLCLAVAGVGGLLIANEAYPESRRCFNWTGSFGQVLQVVAGWATLVAAVVGIGLIVVLVATRRGIGNRPWRRRAIVGLIVSIAVSTAVYVGTLLSCVDGG